MHAWLKWFCLKPVLNRTSTRASFLLITTSMMCHKTGIKENQNQTQRSNRKLPDQAHIYFCCFYLSGVKLGFNNNYFRPSIELGKISLLNDVGFLMQNRLCIPHMMWIKYSEAQQGIWQLVTTHLSDILIHCVTNTIGVKCTKSLTTKECQICWKS